jgi:hypothetical protein
MRVSSRAASNGVLSAFNPELFERVAGLEGHEEPPRPLAAA